MTPKRKKGRSAVKKLTLREILHFKGTIRIPVSGNVPLAEEALQIIETPEFQRLRGVRQLGPTHFVYPGAVHSRFEHSIGTYALSLKYVNSLLTRDQFYKYPIQAAYMAKLLIAASLLHDIGHYPFSHLIEEIGDLPNVRLDHHEERAEELIMRSNIKRILKNKWRLDPTDVCKIIEGNILPGGYNVISTALSSILDLDKLDYLIRDSVHCGINFGLALDMERLLAGLHIDRANSRICLSTKAESYIPALITVRNLMYNEVYWHKTVRSAGAMIKTLIYRLCERGALNSKELHSLFKSQDDRVAFQLHELTQKPNNRRLSDLITPFIFAGRGLYKMIYVFEMPTAQAKPSAKSFFASILSKNEVSTKMCLQLAKSLENAIRRFYPEIHSDDILVEISPVKLGHETFDLESMRLLNERTGDFVEPAYDISSANDLIKNSKRVFVFCHPKRAKKFSRISETRWEKIFRNAMHNTSRMKHQRASIDDLQETKPLG